MLTQPREQWFHAFGYCTFVLFENENYEEWVGVFGRGDIVQFSEALLFSVGDAALVIAGGKGYSTGIYYSE